MEKTMYLQCAHTIQKKLYDRVNGLIQFEAYPEIDAIIFKIIFKDFEFKYAMNHIQEQMYSGGFNEQIEMLLRAYKSAVFNGFFKHPKDR